MGIDQVAKRAVFLDRDGVINHNWLNPATQEWESPVNPGDFRLRAGVLETIARLQAAGYRLILVSNQPSAAKGKCSLDDLKAVQDAFALMLAKANIVFSEFNYAYSHPKASVAGMTEPAHERKPSPFFLERAIVRDGLDRSASWMVGDRGTDIECGHRAGVRTIQVKGSEPDGKDVSDIEPDFRADSLAAAVDIILGSSKA
jgi:D-glycero-D-manno-heptose 1,7-bisphosphate phosphatase